MRVLEIFVALCLASALVVGGYWFVQRHIADSRRAEATQNLGALAMDMVTSYETEHAPDVDAGDELPPDGGSDILRRVCATSTFVPTSLDDVKGHPYVSQPSDWELPKSDRAGWPCLHFMITGPQWHRYHYEAKGRGAPGTTMRATAEGDFDGDGVTSIFAMGAKINDAGMVNVAPSYEETRPFE